MRGIIKDGGVSITSALLDTRPLNAASEGPFHSKTKSIDRARLKCGINRCGIYCELCEAAAGLCLFMCVYICVMCDVCLCEVMPNVQIL